MLNRNLTLAALLALSPAAPLAEKNPVLPPPFATPSVEARTDVLGWPADKTPTPAEGFKISKLTDLVSPRSLYQLPNGDVLVSLSAKKPDDSGESSPNQIVKLTMKGSKLVKREVFADKLNLPFGMALYKNEFFVAEPTRVLKYEYKDGKLVGEPKQIAELPFPKPQRHWTRHLLLSPDGNKLYVAVGSASNVGEDGDPLDARTAAVVEMNRDGSEQRVYAGGLRNPVSLALEPRTKAMWAVVNERDELGDDLPPDYITRVKEEGFYGWPYAYWGKNEDPRQKEKAPELVAKSIQPDFSVHAHTASLGITFTTDTNLGGAFAEGALISQHGSWNRSQLAGYKVLYVPFKDGDAIDGEKDFLTGFIAGPRSVYGRPVATLVLKDGSVLVSDDGGGKIWLVQKK